MLPYHRPAIRAESLMVPHHRAAMRAESFIMHPHHRPAMHAESLMVPHHRPAMRAESFLYIEYRYSLLPMVTGVVTQCFSVEKKQKCCATTQITPPLC